MRHLPKIDEKSSTFKKFMAIFWFGFNIFDKALEIYFLVNPEFPILWRCFFLYLMVLPLRVVKPLAYKHIFDDRHLLGTYFGLIDWFLNEEKNKYCELIDEYEEMKTSAAGRARSTIERLAT